MEPPGTHPSSDETSTAASSGSGTLRSPEKFTITVMPEGSRQVSRSGSSADRPSNQVMAVSAPRATQVRRNATAARYSSSVDPSTPSWVSAA